MGGIRARRGVPLTWLTRRRAWEGPVGPGVKRGEMVGSAGSWLAVDKRGKTTEYGAKAVEIGKLRYIVCVNHNQAAKDAADRAAIFESLERQLKRGDKALIGNTGYRRYLRTLVADRFRAHR